MKGKGGPGFDQKRAGLEGGGGGGGDIYIVYIFGGKVCSSIIRGLRIKRSMNNRCYCCVTRTAVRCLVCVADKKFDVMMMHNAGYG